MMLDTGRTMASVIRTPDLRRSDVVLAGCVVLCVATVVTGLVLHSRLAYDDNPYDGVQYALGFPCVLVGAYVAYRAPRHPIGWVMFAAGWAVWCSAAGYAVLAGGYLRTEWAARTVFAFATTGWVWWRGLLFVVVPMLYPTGVAFGRDASLHRRVLAYGGVVVVANACLFQALTQVPIDFATFTLPSWTEPFQRWHPTAMRAVWVMAIVAAVDLVVRVARMKQADARRHRPTAIAAVVLMAPPMIEFAAQVGIGDGLGLEWVEFVAVGLFLVVLAVGVVRRSVLGFDTIVRRTALYAGVTAVAAGLYVAVVAVFAAVLQDGVGRGPIVATGVVAVSFQPARTMVQRVLDRRVFGDRDEPYRALAGLTRQLGSESRGDGLAIVAEAVRASLQLPAVRIELTDDHDDSIVAAAAAGNRGGGPDERVPILYEGRTVAWLVATLPAGETHLGGDERRLLDDLATAAGAVVQATLLADDLARSRDHLVRAREEERRRLRHDLHDGLGPTLASVALGLDAAASRLADDPELAALLHDLDRALQEAIVDIRRLVQGLRPPALDDLGLVPALREQARELIARTRATGAARWLSIEVVADVPFPPMAAAVEVAAFRIAVEAMTNVIRHSGASVCTVRLEASTDLRVTVEDDGSGLDPQRPAGIGLESMRNRAEELGGALFVGPRSDGGTVVVASLPLRDRVPA